MKSTSEKMERNLALEAVRVTEAAALSASRWMGRGDEKSADQAAVDAMRQALNNLQIQGTVRIGEGERDEAPMLFIGEEVGAGEGPKIDIALDPLEGTTITAKGGNNALAVIAMAEEGGFLNAPDTYMEKIAIGHSLPDGLVDLDEKVEVNLKELASHLSKKFDELKSNLGNIGENKLLLISSIKVIDEYYDLVKKIESKKKEFNNLSEKFKDLKSLVIDYKKDNDNEIGKLKEDLNKFKIMADENKNVYEKMLDTATESIEKFIQSSSKDKRLQ